MATIDYQQVNKAFPGGTHALRDFSLAIEDGEFMVLVGPSGCGKSTALRLLAGLEEATSGDIRINGRTVNGLPPQERDIAMVFQNYALYPHMSVRKNLEFPLRMAGWERERLRTRVAETARLLELEPLLARRPGELSGGQRQRVAMGRALVREPAVFLLDEPLSNLDAQLRSQMRREITALQRRLRTTTIYVTHDQIEAMTMGSRLAVMNRGRLQQVGTPREVYDQPFNVFVATFIGSPRMNLFASVLAAPPGGRAAFRLGAEIVPLSDEWQRRLGATKSSSDTKIIAGLRPEAFLIDATAPGPRFSARVLAVESMGHEQIVHFDAGLKSDAPGARTNESDGANGAVFAARLPSHYRAAAGEVLPLVMSLSQVHLFDENGVALGRP